MLTLCKDLNGMKFDELEDYANSLERYLKNEVKALEERHKEQTAKMTQEQKEEFYDYSSDDYIQLVESFPQTLRVSLFVHCYSTFEHSLNELANTMGSLRGIKITTKDLRDEGIMRAKLFFRKVVVIDFPDTQLIWNEITTLNKIRNCFVHKEGYLSEDNAKQIEIYIADSNGALKLVDDRGSKRIVIASEVFNQNVLKAFETFNGILFKTLLADAKN